MIVYLFANFRGDKMFFSSMAMFSVGEFALLIAQESQKFNIGIDLMSISAAIVFITAILMSLTLNYSDRLYQPTNDNMPFGIKRWLDKYSNYVKAISEELDLDNKYSQNLKRNVFRTITAIAILLLTIFGWRELSGMFIDSMSSTWIMAGYLATTAILAVTLFYIIYRGQKILRSFSEIFANATNTRSTVLSRMIVNRTFIAFTLLIIALLFPFVMFMLGLSLLYLIIPFVMIGIFIWQMHKISQATNNEISTEFPTFQKYSRTAESGKLSWKM
jgi:hypothetical protein